jgi:hypothetical protein
MFSGKQLPIIFSLALFSAPALAHHSMAMFDQTKLQTLSGTVDEYEWTNPHSWIHVMVPNANGVEERWSITGGSPRNMSYIGWSGDTVKPGDEVEVTFHPARDGARVGVLTEIKLPDGTELCNGAECRARLDVDIPEDAPFVQ